MFLSILLVSLELEAVGFLRLAFFLLLLVWLLIVIVWPLELSQM